MHLSSSTPHKKARIEIIPLIDIMFFLLASFMLVSMSMIKLQAIPSNLPGKNGVPPPPSAKPDFTTIGVDKDNNIYFDKDKDPITSDKLPGRLQPIYTDKQKETKVFINADKDCSYESLIAVLDAVRAMGIEKVSFPIKVGHSFDPNAPSRLRAAGAAAPAAPAAPATP